MKTKYILIFIGALLFATSCESKFLDNPPQGVLSEEALQTPEGAEMLCTAAYAALGGPQPQEWGVWSTATTNWAYGSVRSDDALKGGGGENDIGDIHFQEIFTVNETNGNVDAKWYHLYTSVQRCNAALRVLNKMNDADFAKRTERIMEMKFLRAHYYFELSRMYNKIVWFDENALSADIQYMRNDVYSRDEILGLIIDELEEALDLPLEQAEKGRINSDIVNAYLAKVTLYRAYKQDETNHKVIEINKELLRQVVHYCDEVLKNTKYHLLDNFQDLDKVATGDHSSEAIFQVEYSMNDGSASAGRINWANLLNAPQGPYSGDGFFLPSQDLIDAYQTDENGLPLLDTFQQSRFDVWNPSTGKSDFTSHNVDPRVDFIIGRPGVTWKTYKDTPCLNTWVRDQGVYGQHCSKRFFVSPESSEMYKGWPWGASALNWNVIRLVDVMLWKAEALIELNEQLDEARTLINGIRTRASHSQYWVKDFNDNTKYAANYVIGTYPSTNWNQAYARKALRFETRLEKAMEGERFFDLVRWGIAAEVMNKFMARESELRIYYKGHTFQEGKHEYLPITIVQYNFAHGSYSQNPGYGGF